MKLYGIASKVSKDVDDWYSTREEAEAVLAQVLADEPDFADRVRHRGRAAGERQLGGIGECQGYAECVVFWRSAIIVGHVAFALTASFVLGGGLVVLLFFVVWWLVWLAFSLFGAWADRVRRGLSQRTTSS